MYGMDVSTATGGLAATGLGLATGAWVLAAVGLIFAGVALYLLFRPERKMRP